MLPRPIATTRGRTVALRGRSASDAITTRPAKAQVHRMDRAKARRKQCEERYRTFNTPNKSRQLALGRLRAVVPLDHEHEVVLELAQPDAHLAVLALGELGLLLALRVRLGFTRAHRMHRAKARR